MGKRKVNAFPGGSLRPACDYSKRERGDGVGKPIGKKQKPKLKKRGLGLEFTETHVGLRRSFLVPPFSVFRVMSGEWMKRKRQWLALGIKSEVGRGGRERESAVSRTNRSSINSRESKQDGLAQ